MLNNAKVYLQKVNNRIASYNPEIMKESIDLYFKKLGELKMCRLSVIVPIYKVEKYLKQCIDSIIQQHLEDIEVILVDDGSPDKCPQICDEYALAHSNIKVIHKPNGGLSSARNSGIENAVGTYLMFVDSDDFWNPDVDMQKVLSYVMDNPQTEMFLFNILHLIEGNGVYQRTENQMFHQIPTDSVENYYRYLVAAGNLQVAACSKIINRQFVIDHNLYFKDGIKSEDNEWMIRVLRYLKTVDVINQPIYIYRYQRSGSISNTIQKKNIEDLLDMIDSSIDYTETHSGERSDIELSYCSYLWFMTLGLVSGCTKSVQRDLKERFQKSSKVCKYGISKKAKVSYAVYKIAGYCLTIHILGGYLWLKKTLQLNKQKVKK